MNNILATYIVPVHNRPSEMDRCIKSIVNQGMKGDKHIYEIMIVNDASTEPTVKTKIEYWKEKYPFNVVSLTFKEHLERVYAFNAGMLQAQGEWIIFLDSDDEMKPEFREEFEQAIKDNPDANIFNWGGDIVWQDDKVTQRPIFKPKVSDSGQCEVFKSGEVFSGGFAFKSSCLNVTGYLPSPPLAEATSPYAFGKAFLEAFDELKPLYTMEDGHLKTDIGNPWGQDFSLMYMLTRHWMPVQINKSLHITHVRP